MMMTMIIMVIGIKKTMPDFLYGARLQGFTVVVFIVAKSCAWFDEYVYHDSLQARGIEGIGHYNNLLTLYTFCYFISVK